MSTSIQARVLALVGVGVFLAAVVLSLASRSSLLSLEREILAQHERLASALAGTLAAAVDDDLRILADAAAAPRIDLQDGDDGPERAALEEARRSMRSRSAVFFVAPDGTPAVALEDEWALVVAAAKPVAVKVISEQRPQVTDVVDDGAGHRGVIGYMPFRASGGLTAGAVAAAFDISDRRFAELLQPSALGSDLRADIVDSHGLALGSTDPHAQTSPASVRETATAPVVGTPWRVRLAGVGPDPLAPVAAFRLRSLWLTPGLAALALLLGWGIAQSVRSPLARLRVAAERIARGDLGQVVDTGSRGGGDEIRHLAVALERMRQSLKSSMETIASANRELEDRVDARTRELATANQKLEERERVRQQLLRQVISAQEDERKRIARELHDETSQTLAALGMGVGTALASSPSAETRQRLAEVNVLVDKMHEELHSLIVNLRPSVLDDLGLSAAIQWFADRQLRRAGIAVRCEMTDLERRLPAEIETAVFRTVQEAIVNVSRHAAAESVLIQGSVELDRLTIEIEDDGVGFNAADAARDGDSLRGIGLLGMRERMEILGGTLTVDSEPGAGTRVMLQVPIPPEPSLSAAHTDAATRATPA